MDILSYLDEVERELDLRIETIETINASYTSILELLRQREEKDLRMAAQVESLISSEVQSLSVHTHSEVNEEDEYLNQILMKAKLAKGVKGREVKNKVPTETRDDRRDDRKAQPPTSSLKGPSEVKENLLNEHIRNTLAVAEDQKRVNLLLHLIPSGESLLARANFLWKTEARRSIPIDPLFSVLLDHLHGMIAFKVWRKPHLEKEVLSGRLLNLLRLNTDVSTIREVKGSLAMSPLSSSHVMEVVRQWFVLNYCFHFNDHIEGKSNLKVSNHTPQNCIGSFPISGEVLFDCRRKRNALYGEKTLFINMQNTFVFYFRRYLETEEMNSVLLQIRALSDSADTSKYKWESVLRKYKLLRNLLIDSPETSTRSKNCVMILSNL